MNNNNNNNHFNNQNNLLINYSNDCLLPTTAITQMSSIPSVYSPYTPVVHFHGHFYIPTPLNQQQQQHFISGIPPPPPPPPPLPSIPSISTPSLLQNYQNPSSSSSSSSFDHQSQQFNNNLF
ncbi:hypothetical protein Mgra_00004060 [Meloidogyne graminicola]|uniref:Uncharacterized protein n=1 Tax=Meloidogyne graminicola TaxID=189291 RepID=A0A8S9ZTL5_9BILA|nr:hypothetical protein Mgra_00004060 [Meloidogyne graminicola]